MKWFFCLTITLLAGGCAATLSDFQEMSVSDRTEYVCGKHRQVKYLSSQVDVTYQAVSDTESVIARGYRIHRSCKKIPVVIPGYVADGDAICYDYGYQISCQQGQVVVPSRKEYETVCENVPVAIDGNLEKEKLQSYRESLGAYRVELQESIDDCISDVI